MTRNTELAPGTVRIRELEPAPDAPADAPRPRMLEGLAVPYGQLITGRNEQGRRERFAAGAFRSAAQAWTSRADGARLAYLESHRGEPVAVVDLEDTPAGLRFRGELFDTPAANAYAGRVAKGVNGCSVEFDPVKSRRVAGDVDEHLEAAIFAIAGAYAPAYDGARAAVRSRSSSAGGPITMPNRTGDYVTQLTERLSSHRDRRDAVTAIARAEARELSDDELEELEHLERSIPNLEATIARAQGERDRRTSEANAVERAARTSDAAAGMTSSTAGSPIYSGPGAYLRDLAATRAGGSASTEARSRLERALADVTTADAAGLIPKAIIGPVLGGMSTRRPLVESFASVSIGSAGMSVIRPTLTGGDVDEQVTEKTQVTSTDMTITPEEFALKTYAGGVDVSWQLIERSSPSALDLIFRRLANRYARRTEIVAAAAFLADVSNSDGIGALTGAGLIGALTTAASTIAADDDVDAFPDTLWLSLGAWAKLSGITDTNGRPLFMDGGLRLGLGGDDQVKLKPVIVPRFTGDVAVIGASEFVERYELPGSPVEFRAIDATRLGTDVSVAGLFAIGVVDVNAFIKFTFPA